MVDCVECGRKLGYLKGYRHPTMGNKYLLCSHCYDVVDESVAKWREVVLPYNEFFNNATPKNGHQFHLINAPKQLTHG